MNDAPPDNIRALKALAVINRKSGTVRTRGAEAVETLVRDRLSPLFASLEIELVDGDVTGRVEKAVREKSHGVIIAGGGDGTLGSVAGLLHGTDIVMGALPLGTMNLVVQALGFSPTLEQALEEFAEARPTAIDVGLANDRAFLHQVSFGLQPRMAKYREKLGYGSRLGKIIGTGRALLLLALRPKTVRVDVDLDGEKLRISSPMVAITNNPIGSDRKWSIQHRLDSGVLGFYALNEFSLRTLLRMARDYLVNRIHDSDGVESRTAHELFVRRRPRRLAGRITLGKRRKGLMSSLDGEVVVLDNPVTVSILPKSLTILARPQ